MITIFWGIELGYLICDNCHGYYKLKPGESATDFSRTCECGGNLHYTLSPHSIKEKKNIEHKSKDYRIIRLIIGVLIVLIPNFLFYKPENYFFFAFNGIPLLLAGFVSSILTYADLKDGVLNGARVGLFSGVLYLLIAIFISIFYQVAVTTGDLISDPGIFILCMLGLIFTASVGGFIGIVTRKFLIEREKTEKIESQDTVESTVDIQDIEEFGYNEKMVELGYKQMDAISNGEKVFEDLLLGSISDEDAMLQLKDDQKIINEVLTEMHDISPPEKYNDYHSLKIAAVQDICKTFEIIDGLIDNDENKILKTDDLVESSTSKINQAISELNRIMLEEEFVNFKKESNGL